MACMLPLSDRLIYENIANILLFARKNPIFRFLKQRYAWFPVYSLPMEQNRSVLEIIPLFDPVNLFPPLLIFKRFKQLQQSIIKLMDFITTKILVSTHSKYFCGFLLGYWIKLRNGLWTDI